MKIRSMTASFGKLEGETLTFQPGLNIISAPNEWGKSTWCAFLTAMLYGIDSRQRAKQGQLPDKERYKPWSGGPMEGRMEIEWQGRRITLERRTHGRIPMGQFQAYETDTGISVPELTASNCGEVLLGVERSVFVRSAFIKTGDLTVTSDEALSQRLNQLVTTGDDSPEAGQLEKRLRELKNACQYRKTGQLPQVRQSLQECRTQLSQQEEIFRRREALLREQQERKHERSQLQTHIQRLEREKDLEKQNHVQEAKTQMEGAQAELKKAEADCAGLPAWEDISGKLQEYDRLQKEIRSLEMEAAMELPPPEKPEAPPGFSGLTGPQALEQLRLEQAKTQVSRKKASPMPQIAGGCLLALALILAICSLWIGGVLFGVLGLVLCLLPRKAPVPMDPVPEWQTRYGTQDLKEIAAMARSYQEDWTVYEAQVHDRQGSTQDLARKRNQLLAQQGNIAGSRRELEEADGAWDRWSQARKAFRMAQDHWKVCMELVEQAQPEAQWTEPDPLTGTLEESRIRIQRVEQQLQRIRSELDRDRGLLASLPDRELLEARTEQLEARETALEQWYGALNLALETLEQAQEELQRRFAPKIARETGNYLEQLTDGRYDRLLVEQDLGLSAAAQGETNMRPLLFRSDGTADQCYLALRLAVSKALCPGSPVILDDALCRFDESRLASALTLLTTESHSRQILLFTCQSREQEWKKKH